MSNNANGDLHLAIEHVERAKDAGADFIKFQCYTPAELVELRGDGPAPDPWGAEGWTMANLYAKAATPLKWFPALVQRCDDLGLPWFSSVFGNGSLALLEALECPVYKLAALDYGQRRLLKAVQATGKPLIRSSPHDRAPKDCISLYCPSGYPQTPTSLAPLKHYDGLSYHGTDPLIPVLAAYNGAKIVECHVQLHDAPSELEANVSLTDRQFAAMASMISTAGLWR